MTREAIHPGEFLADELEEIAMTRTELARQIDVPAKPYLAAYSWQTRLDSRYSSTVRAVLRHRPGAVVEPAKNIRA